MAKIVLSATKTETREKIAIWLEHDLMAALRKIQEEHGTPISESIRRILREGLKHKK